MLKFSKNIKKPGMHLESREKSQRKEAHNQDRKRSYRKYNAEEHTALSKDTNKKLQWKTQTLYTHGNAGINHG